MRPFSVVAIIAAYNEADILGQVLDALHDEGVGAYVIDDHSTDDTAEIARSRWGRGVIGVEQLQKPDAELERRCFNWERILLRKQQLSRELTADWYIHQDADEFRESPWPRLPLREAIRLVDEAGFNAIDFACLTFRPVHTFDRVSGDVREALQFYEEAAGYDRLQIRCWKKTSGEVNLASSGGHQAEFPGRRVFPLPFLLRHYPIRSQRHGERKVFEERKPRFRADERTRGWHVQYDDVKEGASFVRHPRSLTLYDPLAVRVRLALQHRDAESLQRALSDTREALAHGRELLEKRELQLAARRRRLAIALTRARRSANGAASLEGELAAARLEANRLRYEVACLRASRSWRWTRPARATLDLFSNLHKRLRRTPAPTP